MKDRPDNIFIWTVEQIARHFGTTITNARWTPRRLESGDYVVQTPEGHYVVAPET